MGAPSEIDLPPMKRATLPIVIISLAIASFVWAQATSHAVLRTPSGDRQVTLVREGEHPFFAVDEVLAAFGGTIARDRSGFRAKLGNVEAALASDGRFAVVREDLIEMPVAPLTIENRLFAPWQFFDGLFRRSLKLEAVWDGTALIVRPATAQSAQVGVSVVDLGDLTKVVLQLSARTEYSITRGATQYLIQFATPVRANFTEQTFESNHVSKVGFGANAVEITLNGENISGDPYTLENPFRIVIDLKKGVAPVLPPSAAPGALKPVDVPGIRTIVLDPGHGGKEVGAIGQNGLMEKETTLAICRKLAALIEQKLGARVILTRTDDVVVPLDERTAVANRYKADLFLSVHLNAAVMRGARGSETYFLSLEASDELARKAAESENATAGAASGDAGDLNLILWDLAQQDYLKESSRFAELVQEEMNRIGNIQNRGVKQAPFKVLVGATMPAALVEVGFVSNPDEEAKLRDEAFQTTIATALLQAVDRYKTEYETRLGIIPSATQAKSTPAAPQPPAGAPSAAAKTPEGTQN